MLSPSNEPEQNERKETLQKIKEYVLSLLKNKKERDSSTQKTKEKLTELLENPVSKDSKESKSIWDLLKNKNESKDTNQEENKSKQSSEKSSSKQEGGFELPPEDQDEYMPQDSEFGESLGESPRFAEIYPAYLGYYTQGKKSYFDPSTNLRSKRKSLSVLRYAITETGQRYTYAGFVKPGITAIPLPQGAMPDTGSLSYNGKEIPHFQIDQNSCIYISSTSKQAISFQFALNQIENNKTPIAEDTQKIIFSKLSEKTEAILKGVVDKNPTDQDRILSTYIKTTKKYNTNKQGTLRNKSNSKNYVTNLDASPVLECFSANVLNTGLAREVEVPARLVVGHMIQSVSKDGKAHLNSNNGHAWSEIWDGAKRVRFDATPIDKENGDSSEQNMDNETPQSNQSSENNMDEGEDDKTASSGDQGEEEGEEGGEEGEEGGEEEKKDESREKKGEKNDGTQDGTDKEGEESSDSAKKPPTPKPEGSMTGPKEQKPIIPKAPNQMLDEFIKKAKEDNLTAQGAQLTKVLENLESATSKEEIRKILDKAGLSDFAKEEVDKIGNEGILEEEKKELAAISDEEELEKKLQKSLLDPEYKKKLKEYANILKEKIEEQKKKLKSEMERFGFKEQELALYLQYKSLEQEVIHEVKRQIQALEKILPPEYVISRDEENFYRSGAKLDKTKLVDWKVNGNTKIFQRSKVESDVQQINMFETIIIDRSGSMGSFPDKSSPFYQSIKAAITRAKVLEHFKVEMSIVIFDDRIDEVMNFGETFSDRKTKIPSTLMRAAATRSGGNSQEPITHVYHRMKDKMKQLGGKSFGNISFIGDGDLYNSNQLPQLKAMIDDLKKQGMGVTAYYINNSQQKMPLIEYYFGSPKDGNAIYAKDSADLSQKIIENHKSKLSLLIKKYLKTS